MSFYCLSYHNDLCHNPSVRQVEMKQPDLNGRKQTLHCCNLLFDRIVQDWRSDYCRRIKRHNSDDLMRSSDGNGSGIPICWSFLRSRNYCLSANRAVRSGPVQSVVPHKSHQENEKRSSVCFIMSNALQLWVRALTCALVMLPYFHNSFPPRA